MAEFGENIRRAREELGITQQTLADKLYVTRQAVSRWENGSRYPDLMTAKKLAAAISAYEIGAEKEQLFKTAEDLEAAKKLAAAISAYESGMEE